MNETIRVLTTLRRRHLIQAFLVRFARLLLILAALGLASLFFHLLHAPLRAQARIAAISIPAAALLALLWTLLRRPALRQTALFIDRVAPTRDRFSTALAFHSEKRLRPLELAASAECDRFVHSFDIRPWSPFRIPREFSCLLIPALAALMLLWNARIERAAHRLSPAEQATLSANSAALASLADRAEKTSHDLNSAELRKIAAQIRESARRLEETTQPGESGKAAMREISALRSLIAGMKAPSQSPTPAEMAALAAALGRNPLTKPAAAALDQKNPAAAAQALRDALNSAAGADGKALEEMARAIQEALRRLDPSQQSQLSAQLSSPSPDQSQARSSLEKLAEMLRQTSSASSEDSNSGSKAETEKILAALDAMKFGKEQSGPGGSGPPAQNKGALVAGASRPGATPSLSAPGTDMNSASGLPGTEGEQGAVKSPFGNTLPQTAASGPPAQLNGVLGQGESLQALAASAADSSRSGRRYRELYDAMAPAAEDAVAGEEIPLGARFFVKRYFESIRPAD